MNPLFQKRLWESILILIKSHRKLSNTQFFSALFPSSWMRERSFVHSLKQFCIPISIPISKCFRLIGIKFEGLSWRNVNSNKQVLRSLIYCSKMRHFLLIAHSYIDFGKYLILLNLWNNQGIFFESQLIKK